MRIRSTLGILALLLVVSSNSLQAGNCCTPCPQPCVTTCCTPTVTWVEKTVTCYKSEMREREVVCTVAKPYCHEVTETRKIVTYVPEHSTEKRTIVCMKPVCQMVERTVTCLQPVQVCSVDPCTGCQVTCCKLQPVTKKITVPCTVLVKEEKEVVVPVCKLKPVEKTVQCTRMVREFKYEQVKVKQCYCVLVPYETKIKVPVCTMTCK